MSDTLVVVLAIGKPTYWAAAWIFGVLCVTSLAATLALATYIGRRN